MWISLSWSCVREAKKIDERNSYLSTFFPIKHPVWISLLILKTKGISPNNTTNTFKLISFGNHNVPTHKSMKYCFRFQRKLKISIAQVFLSITECWVVSFVPFDSWPFYRAKTWKTQNTVFGYKKRSRIESNKIFWVATLALSVVWFVIFDPWPFYQAKSWKTQNTVFGYKKG